MMGFVGYNRVLMTLTQPAEQRLKKLLSQEAAGFSVEGFIGTCRGSTPILKPVEQAAPDQKTLHLAGLSFFVNPEIIDRFDECTLDYDRSFFGKGLTATWPHRNGCACDS